MVIQQGEGEVVKRMDWNADLGRIVLSFSYDEMLIEEVKSIAGRKWHRDHKFWSVPLESTSQPAGTSTVRS